MMELLAQAGTATNDAAMIWGFVLLGAAILLLFIELFVPSGGIIALCSGVAVIGSLVAFFSHSSTTGLIAMVLYIVIGPVALWFGFKWFESSPMGRRLILGAEDDLPGRTPEEAYAASAAAQHDRAHQLDKYIGCRGMTESDLRPVGMIRIDGDRHEALAETGVIDANIEVEVVEVYDNQLKVRPTS